MKEKNFVNWFMLFVGLAVLIPMTVMVATAKTEVPEDVEIFYIDNLVCISWPDGSGECHCPCDEPLPVCDECETCETCEECRDCPDCPECSKCKDPKPKCNKGEGNQGEGCDPGNNPDKGNDDED